MLTALLALSMALAMAVSACGINRTADAGAGDIEMPATTALDADPFGSSTTTTEGAAAATSSTTSPEAPDDGDVELIKAIWRDFDASWDEGVDAGLAFLEEHAYPELGLTAESCRITFDLGPTDTFREDVVLDEDSIEPDEGWIMPRGPLAGETPDGTVYVMTIETSQYRTDRDRRIGRIGRSGRTRRSPACSRWATSAMARSSGWPPPWARYRAPRVRCTTTSPPSVDATQEHRVRLG
jgi:hypothetical protein